MTTKKAGNFTHKSMAEHQEVGSVARFPMGDGTCTKVPTILCGVFNSVKLPLAEGAGAPGPFAALTEGHGGFKDAWALAAQRELNGLAPSGSTIHKFRGLAFEDGFGDGTVTFSAVIRTNIYENWAALLLDMFVRTGGRGRHTRWCPAH